MNPVTQMKDPAGGVPPQLLPHMHLISKQRYPQIQQPSLDNVVSWLLEAPKVVHELQPVQWQILECPGDGTIMLVWQPPDMGSNFASDGYVWHDLEQNFSSNVRGYTLEMYLSRSGFRPNAEAFTSHSRRRYRLLPSPSNMGADPNLWVIHYSPAARQDQIPANRVPITAQTHALMTQRRAILQAGILARKEFMLRDRANWPTISPPSGFSRQGSAGHGAHRRGLSIGEQTVEEEEDVSRGDALDFMTPRDVSRMRYEQHHEWMEEILESPYTTMSIIPTDLGLGRKGDLEALTKEYFDAPTGLNEGPVDVASSRSGKMDPGMAEQFTKMANQKLADMQSELDKMRQEHQKRMHKLRKTSLLTAAEKKLRSVDSVRKPSVAIGASPASSQDALDEIVKDVEASTGRKVDRGRAVMCISKGGYQDIIAPQPSENAQPTPTITKVVPSDTAGSETEPQPPAQTTLSETPEQANMAAPGEDTKLNSDGTPAQTGQPSPHQNPDTGIDIDMDSLEDKPEDLERAADEWVMVDNQDEESTKEMYEAGQGEMEGLLEHTTNAGDMTPAAHDQEQEPSAQTHEQRRTEKEPGQTPLDTADFDIGHDFDDVNTAGDALADYGAEDDLNLEGMDDSAFGDAFISPDREEES